jgi:hypothetical protein
MKRLVQESGILKLTPHGKRLFPIKLDEGKALVSSGKARQLAPRLFEAVYDSVPDQVSPTYSTRMLTAATPGRKRKAKQ